MRIGILGPLAVSDSQGRPIEVAGPRLRALLIRLALDPGRPVAVERLIDDLWPAAPPAGAGNALQALVSRLRAVVGRDVVESSGGGYLLALPPGEVDAAAFERAAADGRALLADGNPTAAATELRRGLALWRGPALADVAESDFATAVAVRLDELHRAAVQDLVDADFALGRAAGLVPELEELLAADPLREAVAARLMRALYAAGRQAAALAVHERTRLLLADRLGVDPSPELAAAHLAILRRDPGLDAPAQGPRRTNLVTPITSFVGRDPELARAGDLLARSRLVTLTGPGGAGKTRLAGEVAARQAQTMPDGVWLVPLAAVQDPIDLEQAILVALDRSTALRTEAIPPLRRLIDLLERKRLLLVLDNCEHLIDAVAKLADTLLGAAPGLRVLATSREPLGITGEVLCPVPSLALPPPEATPSEALTYASVRLLSDRAAAVRPGFGVDDETVEPVVRICRALDGIPLAIELAAARLRSLTPGQVADRLDDRFRLLASGNRAATPRHQTLRAIVDWSWELLTESERTMLRRLSVFGGGAGPEAVEAVCALDGDVLDEADVVDLVASLIDKSLVVAEGGTEVRYRLLETVRAYATERLAADPVEQRRIFDAHADWYLTLAERAEPEMRRADQRRWADRLMLERDNCNSALRRAIDDRDVARAVRWIAALGWFWLLRDYETEAVEWAGEVYAIAGDSAPPGLEQPYAYCLALWTMADGMVKENQDLAKVGRRISAVLAAAGPPSPDSHPLLALAHPLIAILEGRSASAHRLLVGLDGHNEPWVRAAALAFRGFIDLDNADIATAAVELPAGLADFVAAGDHFGTVFAASGVGAVRMIQGRWDLAAEAFTTAWRAAAETAPDQERGAVMLVQVGWARMLGGDLAGAREDFEKGIAQADHLGEHGDEAMGYIMCAELARRLGDLAESGRMLDRALELIEPRARHVDVGGAYARAISRLGILAELAGDLDRAAELNAEALSIVVNRPMLLRSHVIAEVLVGRAALRAARGEPARAAELLGRAHALQGTEDPTNLEIGRVREAVVAALGQAEYTAAHERGRATPRDRILSDAALVQPGGGR